MAEHHNDYLHALSGRALTEDLVRLTLDERTRLVQHFQAQIFDTANREGLWKAVESDATPEIDENFFPEEIAALKRLLDTLRFSARTEEWLTHSRAALMDHLWRSGMLRNINRMWAATDNPETRLKILDHVARLQCGIYSRGAIDFLPSRLVPVSTWKNLYGYVLVEPDLLERYSPPDIYIKDELLARDSPHDALTTLHHEQIHVLFCQLAMAERRSMMPAAHSMKKDAEIKLSRVFNRAAASSCIDSSYRHDHEESLCAAQHNAFGNECLRRSFRDRLADAGAAISNLFSIRPAPR